MFGHGELVKELETLAHRMDDMSLTQDEMYDATDAVLDAIRVIKDLPTLVLSAEMYMHEDHAEYEAHCSYRDDRGDEAKRDAWLKAANRKNSARVALMATLAVMYEEVATEEV